MGATAGRGHGALLQRHNKNGPRKGAHLLFGSGGLICTVPTNWTRFRLKLLKSK